MLRFLAHLWCFAMFVILLGHQINSESVLTTEDGVAGLNGDCTNATCAGGLECNSSNICVMEDGTCLSYQWGDDLWIPSCDEDGTYSAVQCKGERLNGRCFCYSKEGARIYGWAWYAKAENMTCACSRRRQELEDQGRADVSLHCSEEGNYEELQCDNGLCWCVNSTTGEPTQRVYPESMMTYLPCYDEDDVGSQYLRQCESKSVARAEVLAKLETHGRLYTHIDAVYCDGDGSYGTYKISGTDVYCIWKNNTQIESYQTTTSYLSTINCNCARDYYIFTEEGLPFSLTCQSNGNYAAEQTSNGFPFCVDSDGFATTTLGSFGETLGCTES